MLYASIFLVGFSGIAAQLLLLRELCVNFYGNEFVIGIILSNWVALEALGFYWAMRVRSSDGASFYVRCQSVFCLLLPLCIFFSRVFKPLLGFAAAETPGIDSAFWICLAILFPAAFFHGAVFSGACKLADNSRRNAQQGDPVKKISAVYGWETAGTIAGGIFISYAAYRMKTFDALVFTCLGGCAAISLYPRRTRTRSLAIMLCSLVFITGLWLARGSLDRYCLDIQWGKARALESVNSVYGSVTAIEDHKQTTLLYNGMSAIVMPNPDLFFAEQFANFPALYCAHPRRALVIGAGAGGIISQLLAHPFERIDYLEIDPLLIRMAEKYASAEVRSELNSPRVRLIYNDARLFLKSSREEYDLVLIGIAKPSDLATNRFFTREFFSECRFRMGTGGILAFWLPFSETYVAPCARDLNQSIYGALRSVFADTLVLSGDFNIFIAAKDRLLETDSSLIKRMIKQRGLDLKIMVPEYIEYRMGEEHRQWFISALSESRAGYNLDFIPRAVYHSVVLWSSQYDTPLSRLYAYAKEVKWQRVLLWAMLLSLAAAVIAARFWRLRLMAGATALAVTWTGFFGMISSLFLIFLFQMVYGYIYHFLGIFIALYMAGACFAAWGYVFFDLGRKCGRAFMIAETAIVVFCLFLAWISSGRPALYASLGPAAFGLLFFISGLFAGVEYPLAVKLMANTGISPSNAGGVYGLDLAGGWLGGILGGAFLLPLVGLFQTALLLSVLKLMTLAFFAYAFWRQKNRQY